MTVLGSFGSSALAEQSVDRTSYRIRGAKKSGAATLPPLGHVSEPKGAGELRTRGAWNALFSPRRQQQSTTNRTCARNRPIWGHARL